MFVKRHLHKWNILSCAIRIPSDKRHRSLSVIWVNRLDLPLIVYLLVCLRYVSATLSTCQTIHFCISYTHTPTDHHRDAQPKNESERINTKTTVQISVRIYVINISYVWQCPHRRLSLNRKPSEFFCFTSERMQKINIYIRSTKRERKSRILTRFSFFFDSFFPPVHINYLNSFMEWTVWNVPRSGEKFLACCTKWPRKPAR